MWLSLANVLHRKVRAGLSVLAVGISISLLIVMVSLSRGSIAEVVSRWSSIGAELWIFPRSVDVITAKGDYIDDRVIESIKAVKIDDRLAVSRVIPVFKSSLTLAGQEQSVWGIDPDDLQALAGDHQIVQGKSFDDQRCFKTLLANKTGGRGDYDPDSLNEADLSRGCELIIDQRLAAAAGNKLGDTVEMMGREFRIVGIIQTGVAARVLAPLQVIRCIKGVGRARSTFYFVQVTPGTDAVAAQEAIALAVPSLRVERTGAFASILGDSVAIATIIPDVFCGIAVVVSFLFILLTVYTMVMERTKEMAILRSLGASSGFIFRQVIIESLLISICGIIAGVALGYVGKVIVETIWPLMTVDIKAEWLALAVVVGLCGGLLSAWIPAWLAVRTDPLTALTID